jgi:hypothetical protein
MIKVIPISTQYEDNDTSSQQLNEQLNSKIKYIYIIDINDLNLDNLILTLSQSTEKYNDQRAKNQILSSKLYLIISTIFSKSKYNYYNDDTKKVFTIILKLIDNFFNNDKENLLRQLYNFYFLLPTKSNFKADLFNLITENLSNNISLLANTNEEFVNVVNDLLDSDISQDTTTNALVSAFNLLLKNDLEYYK